MLQLGSIHEIISALGDPYTTYLGPESYRLVREETASRYDGIGASLLPSSEGYVVVSLRPGPARSAGIAVGDTIVRIGNTPAAALSASRAMARIMGAPGTSVHLVLRRGRKTLDVRVERAVIHAPAVHARLISFAGRRWGDVHVSVFAIGTSVLLRHELRLLQAQGAAGLVLDLREDPGGLLTQAVNVASLFIDRGVVVSLQGAHHPHQVLRAIPGSATDLPLVILVDRYTASAAEIVAAALHDHHRATIVGERTYGKALVQAVDLLGNGAALELSIAHYSTPSGADLAGVGLAPQILARDNPATTQDEALAAALHVLARPTS